MDLDEFLAAPEIVRRLLSQDAAENETVTFTCTVQNVNEDEPYTVAWLFNDKQLESTNDKYSIDGNVKTGICLLTIRNIGAEDEGAYRCVATNKFGSSVTTGFLAVIREYPFARVTTDRAMSLAVCAGRKRSQSPSPSRNASPNRSLSPSSSRLRDRSVSPLRYINLPMSKLARVTEELESLLNPSAVPVVHEEEVDEESAKQPDDPTTIASPPPQEVPVPEESSEVSPVPTSVVATEEPPTPPPVESIAEPAAVVPPTPAPAEEQKPDTVPVEVSSPLLFFRRRGIRQCACALTVNEQLIVDRHKGHARRFFLARNCRMKDLEQVSSADEISKTNNRKHFLILARSNTPSVPINNCTRRQLRSLPTFVCTSVNGRSPLVAAIDSHLGHSLRPRLVGERNTYSRPRVECSACLGASLLIYLYLCVE